MQHFAFLLQPMEAATLIIVQVCQICFFKLLISRDPTGDYGSRVNHNGNLG